MLFALRPLTFTTLVIGCAAATATITAAEGEWRTSEEVRRELQAPLGITWSAQPLRDALSNLSANVHVAIWLDRRIDPTRELEFSFNETPLKKILQQVAAPMEADLGYVGPVVYLGPRTTVGRLWTLAELRQDEAQKLPAKARSVWTRRRPVQWPALSTPRELLTALSDESGCKFEGLEAIPHDLWPAANLPPITIGEQLLLILAGFEQTFELTADGGSIRLIPLPDKPVVTREYTPRNDPARMLELFRQFPQSTLHRTGSKLVVTGPAADQDAISRLVRGELTREPDRKSTAPAETRYTMDVQNKPVGVVLRTLEVKSQLQISIDPAAQAKLPGLVSFTVKEATLQQLLEAATRETGLAFELDGKQLRIRLAE